MDGASAPPPSFAHTVLVLHGPSEASLGARVSVEGSLELGRGAELPVDAAEDRTLSRRHVRLSTGQGALSLRDLGSANGTWVNGERLPPRGRAALAPGDVIELGQYALLVDPASSPDPRPQHPSIVGASGVVQAHVDALERAAAGQANVILHGPVGSGKSLAARELHALTQRGRGALAFAWCDRPGELLQVLSDLLGDGTQLAGVSTLVLDSLDRAPSSDLRRLPAVCGLARERGVRIVMCARASPMDLASAHDELAKVVTNATAIEVPGLEARREDIPWLVRHFFAGLGASAPEIPRAFIAHLVRGAPELEEGEPFEQSILARAMGKTSFPDNIRGLYAQLDVCLGLAAIGQELDELSGPPKEEGEAMPPCRPAVVARDGAYVQVGRERVHLRGRRALRATLARLVANAQTTPWEAVPVAELFAQGWATPPPSGLAMASRVYLAMATLRRVGLSGHLERTAVGYRLRLSRELQMVDAAPSEPAPAK